MSLNDFYGDEGIRTLRFRGVWVWKNEGQKLAMTTSDETSLSAEKEAERLPFFVCGGWEPHEGVRNRQSRLPEQESLTSEIVSLLQETASGFTCV